MSGLVYFIFLIISYGAAYVYELITGYDKIQIQMLLILYLILYTLLDDKFGTDKSK